MKIHTLPYTTTLKMRFLSKDEDYLILSNDKEYLELSLLTFKERKHFQYYSNDIEGICSYGIDKSIFPKNQTIKNFCSQKENEQTRFIINENFDPMNMENFPFMSLRKCFKNINYQTPLIEYSKYYFKIIKKSNNYDDIYGPLNPQLMWIYHNDFEGLEKSLQEYGYISNHEHYMSPLEYSFKLNYNNCN